MPRRGQPNPGQPSQASPLDTWAQQGSAGVHDRLVSSQYSQPPEQSATRRQGRAPTIDTSVHQQRQSDTVATAGQSNYPAYSAGSGASSPPSLSYSPGSENSSVWSVRTNPYSPDPNVDHIDETGNVVRAAQIHYTCLFAFMGCRWKNTKSQEWRTHCSSHLWNCRAPQEFTCPHCGDRKVGRGAWKAGLDHAQGHFTRDRRLDDRYRDKYLCKHLWNHHIISDETHRSLTEPAPFDKDYVTTTHHSHRHRRDR